MYTHGKTDSLPQIMAALAATAAAVKDTYANSYETDQPVGIHEQGATTSVVGSNGRRILIRDDADGVYVGGVLITSGEDLVTLARLLDGLADR